MRLLNHKNIVKLLNFTEDKTNIYLVTELLKDGDLFNFIISKEFVEGIIYIYIYINMFT